MVQFNYQGLSKSSGIYVIFNSYNWRLYVGSTVEFKNRWKQGHVGSLLNKKHSNKFLQSDFNKCKTLLGHDDFLEFHVLKNMPGSSREERLAVEEKWLKVHFNNGKQCYNLCDRAISREGHTNKEARKPLSDEIKKKMSEIHKLRFKNPVVYQKHLEINQRPKSQETIDKIRTSLEGLWNQKTSEEKLNHVQQSFGKKRGWVKGSKHNAITKGKMSTAKIGKAPPNVGFWNIILQSPDGVQYGPIVNMTTFCQEHNLVRQHLRALINKKTFIYKGWTLI